MVQRILLVNVAGEIILIKVFFGNAVGIGDKSIATATALKKGIKAVFAVPKGREYKAAVCLCTAHA